MHGVLCAAERRGGDAFGEEDEALLRLFARDAARWLEPRREHAPLAEVPEPPAVRAPASEPDADAELLRAIADGMTREIEPARLLAASLRPVARATAARVASFYLIDNARGDLACEAQCEGTDVDRPRLLRDAGLTGAALQSGAIVATDRPERDPRFERRRHARERRAGPAARDSAARARARARRGARVSRAVDLRLGAARRAARGAALRSDAQRPPVP